MKYFTKFKPLDLLGFAQLVQVEQKDNFEEFVVDIVMKFSTIDRRHRRELLKLARDVARANSDLFEGEEKEDLPSS